MPVVGFGLGRASGHHRQREGRGHLRCLDSLSSPEASATTSHCNCSLPKPTEGQRLSFLFGLFTMRSTRYIIPISTSIEETVSVPPPTKHCTPDLSSGSHRTPPGCVLCVAPLDRRRALRGEVTHLRSAAAALSAYAQTYYPVVNEALSCPGARPSLWVSGQTSDRPFLSELTISLEVSVSQM